MQNIFVTLHIRVHTSVDCLHTYGAIVIGIVIAAVACSLDISLLYHCCCLPYLPHIIKLGKKIHLPRHDCNQISAAAGINTWDTSSTNSFSLAADVILNVFKTVTM